MTAGEGDGKEEKSPQGGRSLRESKNCPLAVNDLPQGLRNSNSHKNGLGSNMPDYRQSDVMEPSYLIVQMAKQRTREKGVCPRPHCTSVIENPGFQDLSPEILPIPPTEGVDPASRGRCGKRAYGLGSLCICRQLMKVSRFPGTD